jgi:hypothetical protein
MTPTMSRKRALVAEVHAMRDARRHADRLRPAWYRRAVRLGAALLTVSTLVAALVGATAALAKGPVPVTFVGDSVSASISYIPAAQAQLRRGLKIRLDLRVCRRLVQQSCSYQGSAPTTALQAVQGYGRSLGKVLVVKVGYNEASEGYRQGIDRVMRAALAQGAVGVVWVTLRETLSIYHRTNVAIKTAAKRWRSSSSPTGTSTRPGSPGSATTDCTSRRRGLPRSPPSSGRTC